MNGQHGHPWPDQKEELYRENKEAGHQGLMPVILATWEAEIGRIKV
jgi:hypothetical protein